MSNNLFSHVSEEPKIQKNDKHDKQDTCGKDYYPYCITYNTGVKCMEGCEASLHDNNCNDCLWLCFPLTITIDTVLLIPETVCYVYNKCKNSFMKK
jgi:hypothetical protein